MKTRMTELLGIKYPIMQGGMQHLGVPELAAAVSEAGGLGTINVTIYPDPEDLRKAIKEVKAKTDKPFAVNISLIPSLHPGQELFDQVKVILEEGVTAVETAGASPQELADVLNAHKDQVKWIHKAACVKHAKKAESMGADLITMAGFEVAGHPHTDGVGTMVLANRTAREVKVPVLAAGGIADGRGLLAALSLGCEGVVMGTRFVASKECWISENHKNWIVNANENQTVLCQKYLKKLKKEAERSLVGEPACEDETNPEFDSIATWMSEGDPELTDASALASVRAGSPSIEVLVLRKKGDDICFLPWQYGGKRISADNIPSEEETKEILKQKLRLSSIFSNEYNYKPVLKKLRDDTDQYFAQWQYAPKLREELVLLLDENLCAELNKHHLHYDRKTGLSSRKEDKEK